MVSSKTTKPKKREILIVSNGLEFYSIKKGFLISNKLGKKNFSFLSLSEKEILAINKENKRKSLKVREK